MAFHSPGLSWCHYIHPWVSLTMRTGNKFEVLQTDLGLCANGSGSGAPDRSAKSQDPDPALSSASSDREVGSRCLWSLLPEMGLQVYSSEALSLDLCLLCDVVLHPPQKKKKDMALGHKWVFAVLLE